MHGPVEKNVIADALSGLSSSPIHLQTVQAHLPSVQWLSPDPKLLDIIIIFNIFKGEYPHITQLLSKAYTRIHHTFRDSMFQGYSAMFNIFVAFVSAHILNLGMFQHIPFWPFLNFYFNFIFFCKN